MMRMKVIPKSSLMFHRKRKQKNCLTPPSYEKLEPRQLLALLTVTTIDDVADGSLNGEVSLREAIIAANTNASFGDAPAGDPTNDVIVFGDAVLGKTITLSGEELVITEGVTIKSESASNDDVIIDANFESRVFSIDTDQDVITRNFSVTGGSSEQGGGYLMQGGGVLRLINMKIHDNGIPDSNVSGAGVYNDASTVVSLVSTFEFNRSSAGGAIYSDGGNLRIFSSSFLDNIGAGGGGAILVSESTVFVGDSRFERNRARTFFDEGSGGAINIRSHGELEPSFVNIVGSLFDGNVSSFGGGAIYCGVDSYLDIRGDSMFARNSGWRFASSNSPSEGQGGAIESHGNLSVVDSTFLSNTSAEGGAVFTAQSGLFIRVEFKANRGLVTGGAVAVASGIARFFHSTVGGETREDGNTATIAENRGGTGGGLAVYEWEFATSGAPVVTVIGGEFKNNHAYLLGGGIYTAAGSTTNVIVDTAINHNFVAKASESDPGTSSGGGIANFGTMLLSSTEVASNTAEYSAGGIYNGGGRLTVSRSMISKNQANTRGGGMEVGGGNVTIFYSTIGGDSLEQGNVAGTYGANGSPGRGGGIYMSGAADSGTRLRMVNGQISFNTATVAGGGMWNNKGNVIRLQNGVEVLNNRAMREDGGGAYNHGGHYQLLDAVFESNSSRRGAGIFNNIGSATLIQSTLTNNTARTIAGGFFNRQTFNFFNSTVQDNLAPSFPDFFDEQN